jgi:hypothetical protein
MRNAGFSPGDKRRVLLWCQRHCCFCGRKCGTDIQVAHIEPRRRDKSWNIENAIPLCLNCHQKLFSYDPKHPLGIKYTPEELKTIRDETYEKYTRHLIPEFGFQITQNSPPWHTRQYPNVGFIIVLSRMKDPQPIGFRVHVTAFLNGRNRGTTSDLHYSGRRIWEQPQPRRDSDYMLWGNFTSPVAKVRDGQRLEFRVRVTAIDKHKREHPKAKSWVYIPKANSWYLEP